MKIETFFNEEFKIFSNLDNVRSIPSLIDGFKDSQRKAVYGMINNGPNEIKVAQAGGKFALCLHGDTEVKVGDQYYKISLLHSLFVMSGRRGFSIESYNTEIKSVENDECIDVIYKGQSNEFIEIETEDGGVIEVTPDHKVLTERGWIEAKDINQDDFLVIV